MLPSDPKERKRYPLYRGLFQYFPKALAAVALQSHIGGEQHGHAELHWDRNKSSDDADALLRHVLEGDWPAAAWRALAVLEKELEAAESAQSGPLIDNKWGKGQDTTPNGSGDAKKKHCHKCDGGFIKDGFCWATCECQPKGV